MNKKRAVFQTFFRALLLIFVFIPILWGIRTSILFDHNDNSLIPSRISFRTYAEFLRPGSVFWIAFKNSLFVALSTICVMMPIVVMGSYALGRMEFKGKNLGKIFLYLPLVPALVLLIPLGGMMNRLGLFNHLAGVVLLNTIFLSPFCLWILRNFMAAIPRSIEEAATLDGCGRIKTLLYIVIPNAFSGIITIVVYIFIQSWLVFLYSYTVINDQMKMVVTQLVQSFIGIYSTNYTTLCTFSIIALVPPLIFFIFFQKWFIAGLFGNLSK